MERRKGWKESRSFAIDVVRGTRPRIVARFSLFLSDSHSRGARTRSTRQILGSPLETGDDVRGGGIRASGATVSRETLPFNGRAINQLPR